MNGPVQSSREVIEGKLLLALDDPATVAILAGKDDLDLLIYCLERIASGNYVTTEPTGLFRAPESIDRELRARDYLKSIEQLNALLRGRRSSA